MTTATATPTATTPTNITTSLTSNGIQVMSLEQAMVMLPQLGNTGGCPTKTSSKYQFIDVRKIVGYLLDKGYQIQKTYRQGKGDFGKFAITMLAPTHFHSEGSAPNIVIQSANNGTSSFKLTVGSHVFACSNGLVWARDTQMSFKITHKGDVKTQLDEALRNFEAQFLEQESHFDAMKNRILSEDEIKNLAIKAIKHRNGGQTLSDFELDRSLETALADVGIEDQSGNDLYGVFQRLQGNILKGKVARKISPKTGRELIWKSLKASDKLVKFNQELFASANKYLDNEVALAN